MLWLPGFWPPCTRLPKQRRLTRCSRLRSVATAAWGLALAIRRHFSDEIVGHACAGDGHATAAVDSAGESVPTHSGQLEDPPNEGCGSRPELERPLSTARAGIPAQEVRFGAPPPRRVHSISRCMQAVGRTLPVASSTVAPGGLQSSAGIDSSGHQGGACTLDAEVRLLLAVLAKKVGVGV